MAEFSQMTVGYSITGAQEYIENLNAKAIEETKNIILGEQFDKVRSAIEEGWVGQSEINFMNKFKKSSHDLCDSLDEMKKALNTMMSAIEEEMSERDKKIVDELA